MFKEVGLKLEIKTNLKKVSFLEVTFNLITGLYTPYKKPNDNLLYIKSFKRQNHKMVKHTQTIRRQFADELFECV